MTVPQEVSIELSSEPFPFGLTYYIWAGAAGFVIALPVYKAAPTFTIIGR